MWFFLVETFGLFFILFKYQIHNLFGGDSAEFVLNSQTWSIGHPPGYPFYTFLSNIFYQLLFFLPEYFRLNLLSILPTILTVILLYFFIKKEIKNSLIASFSSFLYAVLFPVWLYSEVPEVFALNNLIIVTLTYFILLYLKKQKNSYKFFIFFLLGLIFSHHHTAILFIPGWFYLIKKKFKLFIKSFWHSFIFFLLGLSFYIYAPIASFFNPPLDYENAKTIEGIFRLITRASYGTFKAYTGSTTNFLNQFFNLFSLIIYLLQDFRVIGFLIIILGFFYLKIKNKDLFIFILTTLFCQLFFLFYSNFPTTTDFILAIFERFLIPIYLLFIILFAYGLLLIKNSIYRLQKKYITNQLLAKLTKQFVYLFTAGYLFIIFYSNYTVIKYLPNVNQFDVLAKNILDTVPKNGVLSTSSDSTSFTTYYYYFVKKYRPDIKLVFFGLLNRDYYLEKIKKKYPQFNLHLTKNDLINSFIEKNNKLYNFYLEAPQSTGVWLPYGLLWKYYPTKDLANKDIDRVIEINYHLWKNVYKIPLLSKETINILHLKAIRNHYIDRLINFINLLIQEKRYDQALEFLNTIEKKYDRNNKNAVSLLIKVYVLKKQCLQASVYEQQFKNLLDETKIDDLTSILYYYYYCDKKNKNVNRYLKIYNFLKNDQEIKLKDI